MNLNQIQALLEKLPDQQIMQYAQGGNPQVPQVLAQMEAMRRQNLRKSETMQEPGMKKGGIVRKYAEGGKVSSARANYGNRQAREEAILEEAKRNRSEAMQEPGGPAYALGNIISSGIGGLRNIADAITDNPVTRTVGENFRRGSELRAQRDADIRANEALAQGPTAFQQGQVPAASAPADARAAAALAQGPTEFQTNPQNIPPEVAVSQPPAGGLGNLAPAQTGTTAQGAAMRGSAAVVPGATANPQATPEVLAQVNQAADAQASKFADQYRELFAERAEMRESGRSEKPNAELDRQQAFYYALAKFGATLATTGVWAQAGDVGLEAFRSELEKSKTKQDAFRKESLQIGLAAIDDKLAALGVDEKERARIAAEAQKAIDNRREDRKLDLQQEQIRNTAAFQQGQLKNQAKLVEAKTSGGASGNLKGTDINAATARVDAALAKDAKYQMMLFRNPAGASQYRQSMINKQVQGLRRGILGLDPFDTGAAQETDGIIDFSALE